MYLDAHCHLERAYYGDDVDGVIARAHDAGVTTLIAVGASGVTDGAREVIALCERHEKVFAAIGLHPHEAKHHSDHVFATLRELLGHPKVVALGEIGLDYFYDNSPKEDMLAAFRTQLELGRELDIPIMLHVREREAHEHTWELLDEIGLPERGGVIHCFSAGPDEAKEYLARGMVLSIPGIVTFNKAKDLHQAVIDAPLERLFVETDAPYLAPAPHRGKQNEPAFVVHTAHKVGELKGVAGEEVGRMTRENAIRFFDLPG